MTMFPQLLLQRLEPACETSVFIYPCEHRFRSRNPLLDLSSCFSLSASSTISAAAPQCTSCLSASNSSIRLLTTFWQFVLPCCIAPSKTSLPASSTACLNASCLSHL